MLLIAHTIFLHKLTNTWLVQNIRLVVLVHKALFMLIVTRIVYKQPSIIF
ncbi:hypothetical protein A1OE_639 [Candidatus Endolissoclinum faulkneri L2]|uniref:Uncharacterized protein n=1 Tax=Candidatus Endolissoclinum faulkneri L2 TaxID=1193729 RepID=K7YMT8_9PROT|nr:hypothetical protein A1OE_639 [Candidatus Endolissoclinum faulkneri L2]